MPATIKVSTAAQLAAAIKSVKGGETILLAPGDYGYVSVKLRNLASTVTIKSADSTNDAVISELRVDRSSGFAFSDIDIHRPLQAGEGTWTQAVYVSNSSRIDFVGVDFTGSMDGNAWNDGTGLRVSYSSAVRVVDSTFEQLKIAATFDHDTGLALVGNSVTDVREGFDFAAVHDVAIARNSFTAFTPNYAAGDHSDAIQFINSGVKEGSSGIVIRDNVILQGANGGTQGIFITTQDANPAYRHSDITVENNLYNGDARHGITLAGVDGAVIRGNTVTTAIGGALETAINLSGTTKVVVDHNIAPMLLDNGGNLGTQWTDNIDLWDSKSKKGVTLASIFSGSAASLDTAAYALNSTGAAALSHAGFTAVDGIGAGAFDLGHLASYAHLDGLAGTLGGLIA